MTDYKIELPLWLCNAIEEEARRMNVSPNRLILSHLTERYQNAICEDEDLTDSQVATVARHIGIAPFSLRKRINGEFPKETVYYHD